MNAFWRFLRDKRNQQVLGWAGGGLVVAATGLWAVFLYLFPLSKPSESGPARPTSVSVEAGCSSIAVGGSVTGSTITTGASTGSDCAPKSK